MRAWKNEGPYELLCCPCKTAQILPPPSHYVFKVPIELYFSTSPLPGSERTIT